VQSLCPFAENVILSGGEAGARDFTWAESVDALEGNALVNTP
jgi:hypothetical protein